VHRDLNRNLAGVGIALVLLAAWAVVMVALLLTPLGGTIPLWSPLAVLGLTWLYTGMFITAHDAMHGTISPRWPRLNHALGAAAAGAYAMFDYRMLLASHHRHHDTPAREGDPDWHDGEHAHPLRWFLAFMRRYLTVGQWVRLVLVFWTMELFLPLENILLFWALPSVLSTAQLFLFGTYLPHREPEGGHTNPHNATSGYHHPLVSLLTCFHFGGYHQEHHEQPHQPWWRLPRARLSRAPRPDSGFERGRRGPAPAPARASAPPPDTAA